jgi:hypothetical protein
VTGGRVTSTTILSKNRAVQVTCEEPKTGSTVTVYLEATAPARSISERDVIRWEGPICYWTAKARDGRTLGQPEYPIRRVIWPEPLGAAGKSASSSGAHKQNSGEPLHETA